MNLEKAIEIKIQWRKDNYPPPLADEMNTDALSIEALKAWKFMREHSGMSFDFYLPGETETYCKFCGLTHPGIECPDRGSEK